LSYATGEESKSVAAGTLVSTDFYLVKATVRPTVFKKLADLVRAVTLGAVPGIVSKVVGPIVKDLTSALEARITALAMPTDFRYIRITHHMACGAPGANNDFSAFGETVSCQLPTNCTTLLSPGDVPSGAEMDPTSDPTINAPSTNDGVATDPGYYSSTCVVDGSELYAGSDGSDPPQYWPVASGTYSACTNPAYPSGCAFPALAEEATDEALVSVSGIGDQAVVATLEPNATLTGDETECTAASGFDCVDYPDAPNALGEVQVGDAVFFIELQGTVETVESVLERTAAKLAN